MNKQIAKLYKISEKQHRVIIGLMSGTSMDGLDVAVCKFTGTGKNTDVKILEFDTYPYEDRFKEEIRKVFSKDVVPLPLLTQLNSFIGKTFAEIISGYLKKWNISPDEIDLIASHGQTIYHAPALLFPGTQYGNATLQIGDGDHIAASTGIITLSDFRQKNITAGGEGAPLAGYGDYLLFSEKDVNVILLNLGGISNITFLPTNGKLVCSDIGPGNTMMDGFMREKFSPMGYDIDGKIAASGKVNDELLNALLQHDFFSLPLPRSTGPELFNDTYLKNAMAKSGTENIPKEDVMATLSQFSAIAISTEINKLVKSEKIKIYVSGGGLHNKHLQNLLHKQLPEAKFHTTAEKGILPDAKEAVLFALLANECIAGNAEVFANTGLPIVSMGKISLPE